MKFHTLLLKISRSKDGEFIRKIPLSNDNVTNRIYEIDKDQLTQLISKVNKTHNFQFSLTKQRISLN